MKKRIRYVAAGIGAAAIIGGAGTGVVLAQSRGGGQPTAAAGIQLDNSPATDSIIQELAKNLGITERQLRDALKKTGLTLLDKAVADGKITTAQADALRGRINDGTAPLFGFGRIEGLGKGGEHGPGGPEIIGGLRGLAGIGDLTAAADFLGISVDQLTQELTSGKTPTDIAAAHGKTRDQLKQFLTDAFNTRVQAGVDSGKVTSAMATAMKDAFAKNIDKLLDTALPMGRPDKGGGVPHPGLAPKDGGRRGGPPVPGAAAPPSTPKNNSARPGANSSGTY